MTYIVNDKCIKCKYMDCVEVCPVDCFYEGENMLVIHPDECIDCGVCEPECPIEAIKPDTEPGLEKLLSLNAEYAKIWPNITRQEAAPGRLQGLGGRAGQAREALFPEGEPATRALTLPGPRFACGGRHGMRPNGRRLPERCVSSDVDRYFVTWGGRAAAINQG